MPSRRRRRRSCDCIGPVLATRDDKVKAKKRMWVGCIRRFPKFPRGGETILPRRIECARRDGRRKADARISTEETRREVVIEGIRKERLLLVRAILFFSLSAPPPPFPRGRPRSAAHMCVDRDARDYAGQISPRVCADDCEENRCRGSRARARPRFRARAREKTAPPWRGAICFTVASWYRRSTGAREPIGATTRVDCSRFQRLQPPPPPSVWEKDIKSVRKKKRKNHDAAEKCGRTGAVSLRGRYFIPAFRPRLGAIRRMKRGAPMNIHHPRYNSCETHTRACARGYPVADIFMRLDVIFRKVSGHVCHIGA